MSDSSLRDKALVMIVGPSAIGKSTLMEEVIRLNPDFAYVRSFTTRQKRVNEQSHYSFIDRDTARELRRSGQAITYFEHPTTHDIYGTTAESYPGKYNLLDTLSGSVQGYRSLPFARTVTVAVTAPASDWRDWLLSRYPEPSSEAKKRLKEASISINWALKDSETHWIINREGAKTNSAKEIITISTQHSTKTSSPEHPRAMLEAIEEGIWHKK